MREIVKPHLLRRTKKEIFEVKSAERESAIAANGALVANPPQSAICTAMNIFLGCVMSTVLY